MLLTCTLPDLTGTIALGPAIILAMNKEAPFPEPLSGGTRRNFLGTPLALAGSIAAPSLLGSLAVQAKADGERGDLTLAPPYAKGDDSRARARAFGASITLFWGAWLLASVPARAATIDITYSFAGALTGPPVISGGFLTVNGAGTGSVDQWNPLVSAVWNPVAFDTMDHVNLATGLNNGSFNMTFADGAMLSGTLFENDSMVNLTTGTGPFTQTLTFAAGTGEFAGVTGFASGGGSVNAGVYTLSGSGDLTATGLIAPEPESFVLVSGGMAFIAFRYRRRRTKIAAPAGEPGTTTGQRRSMCRGSV